jgi:4-hydroxybenzoate polyprenyltransferase
MITGIAGGMPTVYLPLMLATHMTYLYFLRKIDIKDKQQCGRAFKHSNYYGLAVTLILYLCNQWSEINIEH